jgi:hypothetical protein
MPWVALGLFAAAVAFLVVIWLKVKNRPFMEGDVFYASRWTKGNHLFPTQVAITKASVVQHTPSWIAKEEQSIHISHVASVTVDSHVMFADVIIETSGGSEPIVCHGHTKGDAARMKQLIQEHQGASKRGGAPPEAAADGPTKVCPFCAETIKAAAKVCRFCGRDLPAA